MDAGTALLSGSEGATTALKQCMFMRLHRICNTAQAQAERLLCSRSCPLRFRFAKKQLWLCSFPVQQCEIGFHDNAFWLPSARGLNPELQTYCSVSYDGSHDHSHVLRVAWGASGALHEESLRGSVGCSLCSGVACRKLVWRPALLYRLRFALGNPLLLGSQIPS